MASGKNSVVINRRKQSVRRKTREDVAGKKVEFEIASTNRPFLAGFESFQLPDELEAKSFQLTAPEKLPIQKRISGADGRVAEKIAAADGRNIFEWRAENIPALPAERQLPPEWTYNSGVSYFVGEADSREAVFLGGFTVIPAVAE